MNLNDLELQRLDGLMQEMRNSKLRVQAEAEWKKEAIGAFVEEIGKERISPKQINQLFKLYMLEEESKLEQTQDEMDQMIFLVEKLHKKTENN